jgi:hypothetical protein
MLTLVRRIPGWVLFPRKFTGVSKILLINIRGTKWVSYQSGSSQGFKVILLILINNEHKTM